MWDELIELVDSLQPELRQAVLANIATIKRKASRRALELAWANADVDGVVYALMGDAPTAWAPLRNAVLNAMRAAAMDTVSVNLRQAGPILRIVLGLGEDPRVVQAVHARLVVQVDNTTRSALRSWVRGAIKEGMNPENAITRIVGVVNPVTGGREGGILGLTANQTQAVRNFRRMLEEGRFHEAMERALRDKRFDPTLLRGDKLQQAQVDAMVTRYEARMLAYRARTIARTEAGRAHSAGQKYAWDTAITQGVIPAAEVIKRWVSADDARVRAHHAEMHNAIIPYDKYFIVRGGSLKTPTIRHVWGCPDEPNCRCVLSVRPLLDRSTTFAEYANGPVRRHAA